MELSPEALEARRQYQRDYYRRNKEKRQEQSRKYWERKARKLRTETEEEGQAG